ncbi:hypothetical protein JCM33774_48910 [Actinophytocola sp. KF-1]
MRALGHLTLAEHDLRDAGRVAEIDEDDPTVIAPAGNPAAQRDGLSGVLGAKRPGLVRADHGVLSPVEG